MKKIFYCFVISFIFMFLRTIDVNAATMTAEPGTTFNVGAKFKINFTNLKSKSGYTLLLIDEANPNKPPFDYKEYFSANNHGCGSGTNINPDKYSETSSCVIDFKVLDGLKLDKQMMLKFVLTDKDSSDGTEPLKVTINKNINNTSQGSTTTTTTTTSQAQKSNNANLNSLTVVTDNGENIVLTPDFKSNVLNYSANVPNTVTKVNVNATAEDSKASVKISDNVKEELNAGESNIITVMVTAEDGTKKEYIIDITRDELTSDATIKNLAIKEAPDFIFDENTFSYKIELKDSVDKLTIDFELADELSKVDITGNSDLKDGSKVKILVTAADGTKKEYIISIVKKDSTKEETKTISAEKNPLVIMALSIIGFGLIGTIIYVAKK